MFCHVCDNSCFCVVCDPFVMLYVLGCVFACVSFKVFVCLGCDA